ncbi:chitinase [Salpingoeca rosetta]|uniref:Chitinase n=1 Tax=Salpingoeca rosetta (strain ATCC 50818 / BSB-021) TaxID=946362 RepID=F2UI87_SALR5|nr:chitinase [Salpingoeca rosetta]EGD76836.1 chitinase [Salpingoeca rosetta]|eukprot:XP_004991208.1 chitinase [Salpingoeca rosetta]
MHATLLVCVILACTAWSAHAMVFGNYFANWAQYRLGNYAYTPKNLAPVADKFDYIVYAFAWMNGGCDGCKGDTVYDWIGQCQYSNGTCAMYSNGTRDAPECPMGASPCTANNFTLVSPEPADPQFYEQVVAFKNDNPDLKILLSVGGWNFPSSIFSEMVASKESRTAFIKSTQEFMDKYNFDGIDVDWEFWCSGPRSDHIKLSNKSFHNLYDVGGKCPDDGQNLLTLVTEIRSAYGKDKMITLATQADLQKMESIDIKAVSEQIDYWHLMAYDYSVSDLPEMCGDAPCFANFTAPNQPLYAVKEGQIPKHDPPFPSSFWSVNYTVQGYLDKGAPADKLVLGLTFYGHSWYIPNQSNWKRFGVPAALSHACYGPFNPTFGAWPGARARLCGLLIYSEIVALIDETDPEQNFFDPATQSDIGYIKDGSRAGEDLRNATPGYVSWNSIRSLSAITNYAKKQGIAGVFAFDASMDVFVDKSYPVVNAVYNITSGGKPGSNQCDPSKGCNVCSACCKSYIKVRSGVYGACGVL